MYTNFYGTLCAGKDIGFSRPDFKITVALTTTVTTLVPALGAQLQVQVRNRKESQK